jgi:hypothetical protein
MSKQLTVHCEFSKIDLLDFNEKIHLYSTSTEKDFRGVVGNHNTHLICSLSKEEASLLAASLRTLLGQEGGIEPKERAVLDTEKSDES